MNLKDKRGAELTVGTIVIVVLAVLVLVVLIVGFTSGWGNLWDNVTSFFGGGTNVDTVKQACATACTTGSKDAFCTQLRTVKYTNAATGNPTEIEPKKSCAQLAQDNSNLGFEACGSITCPGAEEKTCDQANGACVDAVNNACPASKTAVTGTCDSPKICCSK